MLKLQHEAMEDRQTRLIVTVDDARVDKAMKDTAKRLGKQVQISGFRKGKVPYRILLSHLGEDYVFNEALDPLSQAVYAEALEESDLQPYGPGALTDVERNPLRLTFIVPLVPTVELGDYRDLRIDYDPPEIDEKDVADAIEEMRKEQGFLEPLERPAEYGDVATVDIHGHFTDDEGAEQELAHRHEYELDLLEDGKDPVPGFAKHLIGLEAEAETHFEVEIAEDNEEIIEELRGKTLHFEVKVHGIYTRDLPELDDEFAESVSTAGSMDELREQVREELLAHAKSHTDNDYLDAIFGQLLDGIATVEFPPQMVDDDVEDLINNYGARLQQQGLSLDDYLRLNQMTKDDLRADFRETAVRRIERGLLLAEIADAELVSVDDTDLDDEIRTRLLSFGEGAAYMESVLNSPEYRRMLSNEIRTDRAIERLMAIAKGEAPSLE
ncbi:MAG: trigger factor [Chloroflexi bacterium]|nr:trigger factor [Chloroflexota bacterium]